MAKTNRAARVPARKSTRKPAATLTPKGNGFMPTTFGLRRQEDGRSVAKFGTGEWVTGQINGTLYVPLEDAADIAFIECRIVRHARKGGRS